MQHAAFGTRQIAQIEQAVTRSLSNSKYSNITAENL